MIDKQKSINDLCAGFVCSSPDEEYIAAMPRTRLVMQQDNALRVGDLVRVIHRDCSGYGRVFEVEGPDGRYFRLAGISGLFAASELRRVERNPFYKPKPVPLEPYAYIGDLDALDALPVGSVIQRIEGSWNKADSRRAWTKGENGYWFSPGLCQRRYAPGLQGGFILLHHA